MSDDSKAESIQPNAFAKSLFELEKRHHEYLYLRSTLRSLHQWAPYIGLEDKKADVAGTEKRRNPTTGQAYPWLVRSTAMVNQFYFYAVHRDFGPFFC